MKPKQEKYLIVEGKFITMNTVVNFLHYKYARWKLGKHPVKYGPYCMEGTDSN